MKKKYSIIILIILISTSSYISSQNLKENKRISFDSAFFDTFSKKNPVYRDDYFEMRLNKIILSRGIVKTIDNISRYRKNYRLVLINRDAEKFNLTIKYYIYFENKDILTLLNENANFEFIGQFMGFTPLNTRRSAYIIDILLEDGSIVIE